MPSSPLRFIVVHSQRLIVELWSCWILQQFPNSQVSLYTTLSAAFGDKNGSPADICIFDTGNARDDWDEFVDEAYYKKFAHKMLILAGDDDDCLLKRLRPAKVDGIVDLNEQGLCGMIEVIRALLGGGTCISPRYKEALFGREPKNRSALSKLTGTEMLILSSIGAGLDRLEIAKEMKIASSTVQVHRKNIMRKLGVRREGELIVYAFRSGLVKASCHGIRRPGFEMALSTRDRLKWRTKKTGEKFKQTTQRQVKE
jgi:DNA-binding NarL/FixJ family response regulator